MPIRDCPRQCVFLVHALSSSFDAPRCSGALPLAPGELSYKKRSTRRYVYADQANTPGALTRGKTMKGIEPKPIYVRRILLCTDRSSG